MQIVVRQISGLGNQLFQYAAGRYYANRYGAQMRVAVDQARNANSYGYGRPFLLSHFSIAAPTAEVSLADRLVLTGRSTLKPLKTAWEAASGIQVFREDFARRYCFLEDLPLGQNVRTVYLVGYWQTHSMADAIADGLRAELSFKEHAEGKNLEMLERIGQSTNPISLHVRRGDYTQAAEGNIALPIDYYTRSIAVCRERLADPTFFVFSDDIAFARENLPPDIRAVFVDHNDDASSHEDLRLMSSCSHHIIANSTFSWWGAWLNPRLDKIVVAPKHWHLTPDSYYPGLLPSGWILCETLRNRP